MRLRPHCRRCATVSMMHGSYRQYNDRRMSVAFFAERDIPAPDIDLGVGSEGYAEQTARVMLAFDPWLPAMLSSSATLTRRWPVRW
jgi:hypothetical protein